MKRAYPIDLSGADLGVVMISGLIDKHGYDIKDFSFSKNSRYFAEIGGSTTTLTAIKLAYPDQSVIRFTERKGERVMQIDVDGFKQDRVLSQLGPIFMKMNIKPVVPRFESEWELVLEGPEDQIMAMDEDIMAITSRLMTSDWSRRDAEWPEAKAKTEPAKGLLPSLFRMMRHEPFGFASLVLVGFFVLLHFV